MNEIRGLQDPRLDFEEVEGKRDVERDPSGSAVHWNHRHDDQILAVDSRMHVPAIARGPDADKKRLKSTAEVAYKLRKAGRNTAG
jgi:hypothetical protein